MKIIIAAGGSGGHIFPAIALGRELSSRNKAIEIIYVGSDKALDRRIFEKESARFDTVSANKLAYKISPGIIVVFFKLCADICKSLSMMLKFKPDVVVGFGGYVSFPVIFAAKMFRIPTIVHEQNVVPGRANSMLFKLADKVALSFGDTTKSMGRYSCKAILTGNPIRKEIMRSQRPDSIKRFGLDERKFTILIIGGSQGATFLNKTFVEALALMSASLKSRIQIIHITGVKDYEWAIRKYKDLGIEHRVHSFIDNIDEAYGAADLIITRSGASALFELALLNKPMILIPYPYAKSHQLDNAQAFSIHNAALVLEEKDLSSKSLGDILSKLMNDPDALNTLGTSAGKLAMPDASKDLADAVISLKG